jgi:mRNA interferase RelE/StbE
VKYTIEFSKLVSKSLKKIPNNEARKILRKAEALITNPYPNGFKKIQGEENLFRIRSGDYRILYRVFEKRLVILVVNVGHRKDIYQSFVL